MRIPVLKLKPSRGVMVCLRFPADVCRALARPDGLPPEKLHLTLAYLGPEVDPERLDRLRETLREMVSTLPPFRGVLTGYGRFRVTDDDGDLEDVIWVGFDAERLPALRQRVLQAVLRAGLDVAGDHGFTPHVTLARVKPGEGEDYMPEPRVVRVDAVHLTVGGNDETYALVGAEPSVPSAPVETWSAVESPAAVVASVEGLEEWAQGRGDVLVKPDIDGAPAVVFKYGFVVSVAWPGSAERGDVPIGDLREALARVPHDFIAQGVLVSVDGEGVWHGRDALDVRGSVVFAPTDLLALDGDLSATPARERWRLLRETMPNAGAHVILIPPGEAHGDLGVREAVEGVVAEVGRRMPGVQVAGVTVVQANAPYSHAVADHMAMLPMLDGVVKTFGTGDTGGAGIIAPGQGVWRRPRRAMKFDPDQPRDADGKFSETGAGGGSPKSWSNPKPRTAADMSGKTPSVPLKTYTAYHVTRRENAESILRGGFDIDRVKPRWQNDKAVSMLTSESQVRRYFSQRGGSFDADKYAVLRVQWKGRMGGERLVDYASDAHDYRRRLIGEGYDGQKLGGGLVYLHNEKAVVGIEEVRPREKASKTFEVESAEIRENKKDPRSQEPHDFDAAEWTHPNGHPRCIRCGSEEMISGRCNDPAADRRALRQRGTIDVSTKAADGDTIPLHMYSHRFVVGDLEDGEFKENPNRTNPYETLLLKVQVRGESKPEQPEYKPMAPAKTIWRRRRRLERVLQRQGEALAKTSEAVAAVLERVDKVADQVARPRERLTYKKIKRDHRGEIDGVVERTVES